MSQLSGAGRTTATFSPARGPRSGERASPAVPPAVTTAGPRRAEGLHDRENRTVEAHPHPPRVTAAQGVSGAMPFASRNRARFPHDEAPM